MKLVTGAVQATSKHDVILSFVGSQATVQKSGMTFPQNLPERSWERIGANLRELANSSAWWTADWVTYGENTYGWRRYKEAVERTGLDYQTLRNYAWVARRFEHHRRRDSLSFAHHAEVARLSPPEQDYWLRKAEQHKWSRNELRRAVRASLAAQNDQAETPPDGGAEQQKLTTLTIELSAGQLEHFSQAAAAHGLPVDKWVTQVLETVERPTGAQTRGAASPRCGPRSA